MIRERIEDGTYPPGRAITPINDLAAEMGVNRLTIRRVLEPLIDEGTLVPVTGRGFFVAGRTVERDLETLGGFTQTMADRSVSSSVKVLSQATRPAGPYYATIFDVDADAELHYLKRLCLADGEPFSFEEILVPVDVIPHLGDLETGVFSLYEIYAFSGVHLASAWQTLNLTRLNASDARLLDIPTTESVMLFECTSVDVDNRVIEFARTFTRGDRAAFSAHFTM